MNRNVVAILVCVNVALTAALAAYLFMREEPAPAADEPAPPPVVNVDFATLEAPVTTLNANLDQLTSTIQRFNTSLIQYDFLKGEMDRLTNLDRTIGIRAQAQLAQATEENVDETKEAIAKLQELANKVQGEQQSKRQTMLQLISGLEKRLADLTGTPPVPPAAAPTPMPAPVNPAPSPAQPESAPP
jgi:uncharacterized membrane protein